MFVRLGLTPESLVISKRIVPSPLPVFTVTSQVVPEPLTPVTLVPEILPVVVVVKLLVEIPPAEAANVTR